MKLKFLQVSISISISVSITITYILFLLLTPPPLPPTTTTTTTTTTTGLPMVLDVEQKRIRLLDDGTDLDPLERYNFGNRPELLFAPCSSSEADETCVVLGGRSYASDPVIRFPANRDGKGEKVTSSNTKKTEVNVM